MRRLRTRARANPPGASRQRPVGGKSYRCVRCGRSGGSVRGCRSPGTLATGCRAREKYQGEKSLSECHSLPVLRPKQRDNVWPQSQNGAARSPGAQDALDGVMARRVSERAIKHCLPEFMWRSTLWPGADFISLQSPERTPRCFLDSLRISRTKY